MGAPRMKLPVPSIWIYSGKSTQWKTVDALHPNGRCCEENKILLFDHKYKPHLSLKIRSRTSRLAWCENCGVAAEGLTGNKWQPYKEEEEEKNALLSFLREVFLS